MNGRRAAGKATLRRSPSTCPGTELIDLERARLALRSYGIPVDRGRIVREAIAILLADLDAAGENSLIAQRLRETT